MNNLHLIRRNDERYPGIAQDESPKEICVLGTEEQTAWVAAALSNWYPGCDYIFYEVAEEE